MQTLERPTVETPRTIRRLRGYFLEWEIAFPGGEYGDDMKHQFRFLPGAFDAAIAAGREIIFSTDLNGQAFARTSDQTLRITADDHGLMADVTLMDSPQNRGLIRLIDCGKTKGWSFKALPSLFGFRPRIEDGIRIDEHTRCGLSEVCVVINKRPRAPRRLSPIFLPLV